MRFFFIVFLTVSFVSIRAQVDSLVVRTDSVSPSDTIAAIVLDSISDVSSDSDTLHLSSANDSWSRISADTAIEKPIVVRKDSGMVLITAKIGFSDNSAERDWDGYSIKAIPPIALQAEYFHNDFFSYGAQVVYGRDKYINDTLSVNYTKESIMGVAAIGTFHYGSWLQDITHNKMNFGYLDLYLALAFRFDIYRNVYSAPWDEELAAFDTDVVDKSVEAKFRIRPIFGARYYISDRFSINIEMGRGNLGLLTSSVSWLIDKPSKF